ncbi:hypothetical protein ACO2Q3_11985 [Caulobacter sp. KR2-114]|uniref:cysteine dioxygenase family protein n=1 Tax=Caulobacter sp. KR2-114 TaxID=3400912 RepID=UPI003C05449E
MAATFELAAFVDDCRRLAAGPHGPARVLERMREALADPAGIAAAVQPLTPGVGALDAPLHRADDLTVLNVTLAPGLVTIPHDHAMWAVVGIYQGEEVNTFYREAGAGQPLAEANRRRVPAGEAILLGEAVVHAIENPLATPTLGLHVYGGDLIGAQRRMWDGALDGPHPYDIPQFYRWSRELALSRRAAAGA